MPATAAASLRADEGAGAWPPRDLGRRVGAHGEPGEKRHRYQGAHRDQKLESDASLIQRLAEIALARKQDRRRRDE